ncbi:MAG: TolC family protein [Proteobacteria bacterium]|nr:TolC family protein [Pseudomonadota bacterium]
MRWSGCLMSFLLGVPVAHAGDVPLSLESAVEQALRSAPQLDARAEGADAARSLTVSAGRLPDPQLILGVDNLPVSGPDALSATRDAMTMRKVGLMQEFPSARKRRLQRERAEAEAGVADAELQQSRLEVARDVAAAWIRRATAEVSLRELMALEPEVALQADAVRAAVASGRSTTAEALAADTEVGQFANRILQMRSEVRKATMDLGRWIDVDPSQPLAAMPSCDELATPAAALLASADQQGPMLPYESRMAAARAEVDLADAERRPDWSAELVFAKRAPDLSNMVMLQFRVGLPLFTRHRQDPVVSARHADLRRLEAERATALRAYTTELKQMLADWELLGSQIRRYERDLLPLARERSRAALAAYGAGRGELRAVLEARRQEIEFVLDHARLQGERGRDWAFLRFASPLQVRF